MVVDRRLSTLSMAKTHDIAAPINTQRSRPASRSVENELLLSGLLKNMMQYFLTMDKNLSKCCI